jgi:hypothetical protein
MTIFSSSAIFRGLLLLLLATVPAADVEVRVGAAAKD